MLSKNSDNSKRMNDILPTTFFFMKLCGLWQPFNLTSFSMVIYIVYSIFTIFTMISVGFSLVCLITISSESIKDAVAENSFILFTLLNGWVKAIILLSRRKDIKSLLNGLLEKQCQPHDCIELDIQNKIDKEAKKITIIHATSVGLAVTSMYLAILSKKGNERIKILNTWRPYELESELNFWITWVHEFIGHFVTSMVHLSADTLVPGLMIQLCCQLNFMRHRLNDFPVQMKNVKNSSNYKIIKQELEKIFISKITTHHNSIFQFAERLRTTFIEVLFTQFSLSLIIICFSGYKISNETTIDFANLITLSSYIVCMLMQLFLFCWYGNELMLSSCNLQDAVYETNWLFFENKTKRSLIIIMLRTTKPILISAGSIILVNLSSFVMILKASYTAYNVLQHNE